MRPLLIAALLLSAWASTARQELLELTPWQPTPRPDGPCRDLR